MYFTIMDDDRAFGETLKNKLESEYHAVVDVYHGMIDLDQIKHVPDILFLDVIFKMGQVWIMRKSTKKSLIHKLFLFQVKVV